MMFKKNKEKESDVGYFGWDCRKNWFSANTSNANGPSVMTAPVPRDDGQHKARK